MALAQGTEARLSGAQLSESPRSDSPSSESDALPEDLYESGDCAFGVLGSCLVSSTYDRRDLGPRTRLEWFAGYKPFNLYYQQESYSCSDAGCDLSFAGPAASFDAYYHVSGHPRSDDYLGIGISAGYIPIVTGMRNNTQGFDGELGRIDPGDGSLGYVPIRLAFRRSNFLYVISSKYLVSSLGVGVALPVAQGAGRSFTGADGLKLTIGGKLGAELPVGETFRVGLSSQWNVIWYGGEFHQASFITSYGLHWSTLL
jgi:hypothetical protein